MLYRFTIIELVTKDINSHENIWNGWLLYNKSLDTTPRDNEGRGDIENGLVESDENGIREDFFEDKGDLRATAVEIIASMTGCPSFS